MCWRLEEPQAEEGEEEEEQVSNCQPVGMHSSAVCEGAWWEWRPDWSQSVYSTGAHRLEFIRESQCPTRP